MDTSVTNQQHRNSQDKTPGNCLIVFLQNIKNKAIELVFIT